MLQRWRATNFVTIPTRVTLPLVVLVVGLSLIGSVSIFPARFCDFRAFYCAGRTVLAGLDPYRQHPLQECEQALPGPLVSSIPRELTIPAPYPGYVLLLFSLIARLPFNAAAIVWTLGSCSALIASIVLVARVTSTSLRATAIVLAFPAAIVPLPLGQPTLLVLLAIASCAALLCAQRPRLAAVAALGTAIDPHVGLAVCLGLFVGIPQTRVILIGGSLALCAMSAIIFGPTREWEYFHDVLPVHALVNVAEFSQFSVSNLAFTAGIEAPKALSLGNVWYLGSLIVGIVVAQRLRSRLGIASLAFVPVAFAVFGGAHTHLQQLALATPAFLFVTSVARGSRRALLVAATFVASVPWLIAAPLPYLFPATGLLGVVFSQLMATRRLCLILGAASFSLLTILCIAVVESHPQLKPFAMTNSGNPLAEISWGTFVRSTSVPPQAWYLAAKLPTLIAFCVMFVALLGVAAQPCGTTVVRDRLTLRGPVNA